MWRFLLEQFIKNQYIITMFGSQSKFKSGNFKLCTCEHKALSSFCRLIHDNIYFAKGKDHTTNNFWGKINSYNGSNCAGH